MTATASIAANFLLNSNPTPLGWCIARETAPWQYDIGNHVKTYPVRQPTKYHVKEVLSS